MISRAQVRRFAAQSGLVWSVDSGLEPLERFARAIEAETVDRVLGILNGQFNIPQDGRHGTVLTSDQYEAIKLSRIKALKGESLT